MPSGQHRVLADERSGAQRSRRDDAYRRVLQVDCAVDDGLTRPKGPIAGRQPTREEANTPAARAGKYRRFEKAASHQ